MKKLLSFAAVLSLLAAASCSQPEYKLTANFGENAQDGNVVYLIDYDKGDTIDSAVITNKQAVFAGTVEKAFVARILAEQSRSNLIIEAGELTLNWEDRKVEGGALNDSIAALNEEAKQLNEEAAKLQQIAKAEKWTEEKFAEEYGKINDRYNANFLKHYEANKDNAFGWMSFYNYLNNMGFGLADLKAILAEAPAEYSQSVRIERLVKGAETLDRTKEGEKMVDFAVKTEDGGEVKLSDYVGKGQVVVVDFWASWCAPCRREISGTLMEMHKKYDGKGLKILGVACWDKLEDTKKAIEELQIPWEQILDTQYIASDAYGFNAIPHIIVFSADGTILSRGLQGEELMAKVDELMAEKK